MGRRRLAKLLRIQDGTVQSYQKGHLDVPYLVWLALDIYAAAIKRDHAALEKALMRFLEPELDSMIKDRLSDRVPEHMLDDINFMEYRMGKKKGA